ncbi:hypothetical protein DFP72DRAFT_931867 [Ephemerocybe angulata]|uniref:F-box domain-containing protein n=1 Tax=Ephemerocybe angulata TaxID=980116 RepID=A0A8H6HB13_9AGAR|nr:hypothetical protein DFP72DRAFT_931867 [Tulosesus angulatus]
MFDADSNADSCNSDSALARLSKGVIDLSTKLFNGDQPLLATGPSVLPSFVELCLEHASVIACNHISIDKALRSFLRAWNQHSDSSQQCDVIIEFATQETNPVSLFALLRLLECEIGYTVHMTSVPEDLLCVWSDMVPLLCDCVEMHLAAVTVEAQSPCMSSTTSQSSCMSITPQSQTDNGMGFEERVIGLSVTLLRKALQIKGLPVIVGVFSDSFIAIVLTSIEESLRTRGFELVEVLMCMNSLTLRKHPVDDWLVRDDKSDLHVALAVAMREGSCESLMLEVVASLTRVTNRDAFSVTLAIEFLFALTLIGGLSHTLSNRRKIELVGAFSRMVYRSPLVDETIRQMWFIVFRSLLILLKNRYSPRMFREANLELLLGVADLSDLQVDVGFRQVRSDIRAECASCNTVGGKPLPFPEGPFTSIPPELLSAIFILACPSLFKNWVSRQEVLWLASVCQRWRTVCFDTPRLWCAVVLMPRHCSSFRNGTSVSLPITDTYRFLTAWLQRARSAPKQVILEGLHCRCYEAHHLASIPPIFGMLLSQGPDLEHLTFNVDSVIAYNSYIASLPLADGPTSRRPWDRLESLFLCFNYLQDMERAEPLEALQIALETLPRVKKLGLVLPPLPTGAVIGTPLNLANNHMRALTELTLQSSWIGVSLLDLLSHLETIRRLSLDFEHTHELRNRENDSSLLRLRAVPIKLKWLDSLTISNSDADLLRYITTPRLAVLHLSLDMGFEDGISFPSLLSFYISRSHIQRTILSMTICDPVAVPSLLGGVFTDLSSLRHLTISDPCFIGSEPLFLDICATDCLLPSLDTLVLRNFPDSYDVSSDRSRLLTTHRRQTFNFSFTQ